VSRTDQGQSVDLGGLNIEQEIAQANVDDIEEERNLRPSTRRVRSLAARVMLIALENATSTFT
jgi:hypothetical protein